VCQGAPLRPHSIRVPRHGGLSHFQRRLDLSLEQPECGLLQKGSLQLGAVRNADDRAGGVRRTFSTSDLDANLASSLSSAPVTTSQICLVNSSACCGLTPLRSSRLTCACKAQHHNPRE